MIVKNTNEFINEFINNVRKIMKAFKDSVAGLANIPAKNQKEMKLYQTKWPPVRDTRLKSQVLLNKPKHLKKKVIR